MYGDDTWYGGSSLSLQCLPSPDQSMEYVLYIADRKRTLLVSDGTHTYSRAALTSVLLVQCMLCPHTRSFLLPCLHTPIGALLSPHRSCLLPPLPSSYFLFLLWLACTILYGGDGSDAGAKDTGCGWCPMGAQIRPAAVCLYGSPGEGGGGCY